MIFLRSKTLTSKVFHDGLRPVATFKQCSKSIVTGRYRDIGPVNRSSCAGTTGSNNGAPEEAGSARVPGNYDLVGDNPQDASLMTLLLWRHIRHKGQANLRK